MRRTILYFLTVLIILTVSVPCYAQKNAWLLRSWPGRAYLLGNKPESYNLVLTIHKVKGNKFEGIMKISNPSDTSVNFDTEVTGIIHDKYLHIHIDTWKVNCSTCKPQTLAFSIESERFLLKGEAKGCSVECTWITEFATDMSKFDLKIKEELYAFVDEVPLPEPDTETLVQNTDPLPETSVAALPAGEIIQSEQNKDSFNSRKPPASLNKSSSITVQETVPEPQRVAVLPAGEIIQLEQNRDFLNSQKPPVSLDKNSSITVQETVPEPQRFAALPAGEIIQSEQNKDFFNSQKLPVSLNKNSSITVEETVPEPQRVAVLPAGDIIKSEHRNDLALSQKPPATLDKTASMVLQENIPEPQRIAVLPAGDIASSDGNSDLLIQKKSLSSSMPDSPSLKTPAAGVRDTVSLLPTGYAERKKNVVRTLIVNTDSITLRVYDNSIVDGDIVSVVYNEGVVVDKLSLTSRALVIKIPVNKGSINKLVFHAHNLGEFPPNTAKLEVLYGDKKEELTISSDYTISSAIDIEYEE